MTIRNANPDDLDRLADLLHASDDGGAYGKLGNIFDRARRDDHNVTAEVSSLQPLLQWLMDAAEQLRNSATILRCDDAGPGTGAFASLDLETQLLASSWQVSGQEDADEFAALAQQEDLSEDDLRRMEGLLGEWDGSPDFAGYVVDEIGMEEFLRLSQRIDEAAGMTEDFDASALQTEMGNVLANAFWTPGDMTNDAVVPAGYEDSAFQEWLETPQGQRYEERLNDFNEVGTQELYADQTQTSYVHDQRMAYDVAIDILERSDAPIDEHFFEQTMNHMVNLEQVNPDIWNSRRYDPDNPDVPGWNSSNDVVDRMLGLGARNPDAVESYFDPNLSSNLDYFLGTGDDARDVGIPDIDGEAPGLAAALEAAATGTAPGAATDSINPYHSPVNIRIAEVVWNRFADDRTPVAEGGDFAFMRPTLGVIAADYIADMQPASQQMSRYEEARFETDGSGLLIADLASDQDIYLMISAANSAYTDVRIEEAILSNADDPDEMMGDVGRASEQGAYLTGLLADAHAKAGYEEIAEGDASRNENVGEVKEYTDIVVNEVIARIPVAGGLVSEGASRVTDSVFGQFEADNEAAALAEGSDRYEGGRAACISGSSRSASAAFEQAGVTGVDWDDIRDEIEKEAAIGFDAGTIRDQDPSN